MEYVSDGIDMKYLWVMYGACMLCSCHMNAAWYMHVAVRFHLDVARKHEFHNDAGLARDQRAVRRRQDIPGNMLNDDWDVVGLGRGRRGRWVGDGGVTRRRAPAGMTAPAATRSEATRHT